MYHNEYYFMLSRIGNGLYRSGINLPPQQVDQFLTVFTWNIIEQMQLPVVIKQLKLKACNDN